MIGGFPPPSGTKEERELLSAFKSLSKEDKQTLLKFAEFLRTGAQSNDPISDQQLDSSEVPSPNPIKRPAEESVIKAIKRLNKTYFMVDTSVLFNQTSELMTQHILKGREAALVIDELEVIFKAAYEDLL